MFSLPIPWTTSSIEAALPFPAYSPWLRAGGMLLLGSAFAFVLLRLYAHERTLVSKRVSALLLLLRLAAVAVIFLTLGLQPSLVATAKESVPSRVLILVDGSDSLRVLDPHRPDAEKFAIARALGISNIDATTRMGIAERVLNSGGADLLAKLKEKHAIELLKFDQTLGSLPMEPAKLKAALDPDRKLDPNSASQQLVYTDLKLPYVRAGESAADTSTSKLVGVVVLTDGRHNWGDSPGAMIQDWAARKIPVYPVVLAPKNNPPDVAVLSAKAQTATVFKGSTVPVEVTVRVTGWPAGPIPVSLELPKDERGTKPPPVIETIQHDGKDQTYQFALRAKLDSPGPQSMTVTAKPVGRKDDFPGNNSRIARVNVVKDRARVLLVDGEARWEFHYLHTCLGRDENMDVRSVVFRQPRITKATDESLKKFGIPSRGLPEGDVIPGYDCIVLGDVERDQLKDRDLAPVNWDWLEKYVAEDGGTLVIVAGKRAMPLQYLDESSPIKKLLPIKQPGTLDIRDGFRLQSTPDGQKSWFLQLGDTSAKSREIWETLPPHFWCITGEAKDGAEVLATARDRPAIVRQNYGFGRVLYVGLDSTWRWRYRVGDAYHHKFWGQVAQWAASDRLLPTQNATGTLRFGTREPTFRTGQDVEVIARGTEAVKKLSSASLKGVRVLRLPQKDGDREAMVGLTPLTLPENRNREVTGKVRDLPPGKYGLELEIPDWTEHLQGAVGPDGRALPLRSTFEVLPPDNEELVELSSDEPLLNAMADSSGGASYTPDRIDELIAKLTAQQATVERRAEYPARKSWLVLALVLAFLAAEWGLRKWAGLP